MKTKSNLLKPSSHGPQANPGKFPRLFLLAVFFILGPLAVAPVAEKIYIDIGTPGTKKFPIAIPAPALTSNAPAALSGKIASTLKFDLELSGLFKILPPESYLKPELPTGAEDFASWRTIGAEGLVRIKYAKKDQELSLTAEIFDPVQGLSLSGKVFNGAPDSLTALTHQLANEVVRAFTGTPGIFGSRIAYESNRGGRKEIFISDLEQSRELQITSNRRLNLSPAWSPDGSQILYTSYLKGNPDLYRYDLRAGKSESIAHFPGLNLGPVFSPSGKELALTLSRDNDAEIYIMNLGNREQTRLTNNQVIDVQPSYSPDGKKLAFTSSRAGSPQIYVMDSDGKNATRLTFQGSYNCSPAWSPRGDRIAYTRQENNRFSLFTIKPDGTEDTLLVGDAGSSEDPAWSPDGRLIAFATNRTGDYDIWVVNFDGSSPRPLISRKRSNETAPAWSPVSP
jgi:TolB protein